MFIVLLASGSCDVHEFPEPRPTVDCFLDLRFNTDWVYQEQIIPQSRARGCDLRYIVRIFPQEAVSRGPYDAVEQFVFTRPYNDGYDCILPVTLPVGDYSVKVWCDHMNPGDATDRFYDTKDFARISLCGDHVGNEDERDGFRGDCDVSIISSVVEQEPETYLIEMERPLAKFEFITTDLDEFISRAQQAAAAKEAQERADAIARGEIPDTESADSDTRVIDISSYKIVFKYSKFMPNVYSIFTDKPVDSATGVSFESRINMLSSTEASLGFDYVFVNGRSSSVAVEVELFDKDGNRIAKSNSIDVDIQRSRHTLIRGRFLTQQATGGVVIDPSFEDDFNIVLP